MKLLRYITVIIGTVITLMTARAEEPATYRLEVLDFSELNVVNNLNVEYFCSADSAGYAYFTCQPSTASQLLFENSRNCLKIRLDTEGEIEFKAPLIRVYSTSLTKVENTADSTVRVHSNVPVQHFKARVVGNGTVVIDRLEANSVEGSVATGRGRVVFREGTARQAKYSSVGTGPIEAGGLKAQKVKTVLFGTGDIDCTATESLTVYGAGTGKVFYSGHPEKVVNRSMGVKAFDIESNHDEGE